MFYRGAGFYLVRCHCEGGEIARPKQSPQGNLLKEELAFGWSLLRRTPALAGGARGERSLQHLRLRAVQV
jgi:hypothetical protein